MVIGHEGTLPIAEGVSDPSAGARASGAAAEDSRMGPALPVPAQQGPGFHSLGCTPRGCTRLPPLEGVPDPLPLPPLLPLQAWGEVTANRREASGPGGEAQRPGGGCNPPTPDRHSR